MLSAYWQLLRRNPNYARLWLADAVSLTGDWFSLIALSVLVSRESGGSGLAVSGLLLSQLLPAVVVGPLVGVLVDRLDRRVIMIASDLARVVITLGFLLVRAWSGSHPVSAATFGIQPPPRQRPDDGDQRPRRDGDRPR